MDQNALANAIQALIQVQAGQNQSLVTTSQSQSAQPKSKEFFIFFIVLTYRFTFSSTPWDPT
jgi:hypothetical protein